MSADFDNLTQLPPCATPNCKSVNKLRVYYYGAFRCGDCVDAHVKVQMQKERQSAMMAVEVFNKDMEGIVQS